MRLTQTLGKVTLPWTAWLSLQGAAAGEMRRWNVGQFDGCPTFRRHAHPNILGRGSSDDR